MARKIKNIVIVGADIRQKHLFSALKKEGYKCSLFSNFKDFDKDEFYYFTEKCDVLILPLPASNVDGFLNCNFENGLKIKIGEILLHLNRGCTLIGNKFSDENKYICKAKKIRYIDIYADNDFVDANTIISAEGALFVLMSELEIMLRDATVGIVGYGRLGSAIAKLLLQFETRVCVMARRQDSLDEAAAVGCDTSLIEKNTNTYKLTMPDCKLDAVFNTVEYPLFVKDTVKPSNGEPLYFELASGKGGFSDEFPENEQKRIIRPGSLPLKYAPKTAAELYAKCIIKILEKGG